MNQEAKETARDWDVAGGDENGETLIINRYLENCPSCGTLEKVGIANTSGDDIGFAVLCYPCGWQVNGDTVDEAIENWNRRYHAVGQEDWIPVERQLPTWGDDPTDDEDSAIGVIGCVRLSAGDLLTAYVYWDVQKQKWQTYAGIPQPEGCTVIAWHSLPKPYISPTQKGEE